MKNSKNGNCSYFEKFKILVKLENVQEISDNLVFYNFIFLFNHKNT